MKEIVNLVFVHEVIVVLDRFFGFSTTGRITYLGRKEADTYLIFTRGYLTLKAN